MVVQQIKLLIVMWITHLYTYSVPDFCSKIRVMFDAVKPLFERLKLVVPLNDYYR